MDEELDEECKFLKSLKQTKYNLSEPQKNWRNIDVKYRIIRENIDRGIQNIYWIENVYINFHENHINQAEPFFEENIYPKIRGIVVDRRSYD
ncbi:MAG: hypothetical protein ACFFG0_14065 [Candidatus Thorarchaeota archaeon]